MRFYDVSLPISAELPVWPGDPPVVIEPAGSTAGPAVSRISTSSHTGTHVDAPAHFYPGSATVEMLALDALIGPAWLAYVATGRAITATDLEAAGVPALTTRLLLRTPNSRAGDRHGEPTENAREFDPGFVALAPDAAGWLLERGVRVVGIDGPSIEAFDAPGEPVHRALLAAGVVVVEGLALAGIEPGSYTFICLPLPLRGGDGAPARAVLVDEQP